MAIYGEAQALGSFLINSAAKPEKLAQIYDSSLESTTAATQLRKLLQTNNEITLNEFQYDASNQEELMRYIDSVGDSPIVLWLVPESLAAASEVLKTKNRQQIFLSSTLCDNQCNNMALTQNANSLFLIHPYTLPEKTSVKFAAQCTGSKAIK